MHLDANLPQAHAQLGWVLVFRHQHDDAIAEFERAFSLNPNFIDHRFAHVVAYAGEPARAIKVLHANMRLDPFQPPIGLGYMGHAYYLLKRYAEAVATLREYAARAPELQIAHLWRAAAHAQSGQLAEASAEAAEVLRINPSFTIEKWKCQDVYKLSRDGEHIFDGLRKAGLPED